tara:strand:+ start:217 stop:606 length:390 start_codon:yes stop_codon:yes gene_type:complete
MQRRKNILDYVEMDTLLEFGFNYAEPSTIVSMTDKIYKVYTSFYSPLNAQILIGEDLSEEREWFFDVINNMSREEMQDERHGEWLDIVNSFATEKNRVEDRDLIKKLSQLSHSSVHSSNPCPTSGEMDL